MTMATNESDSSIQNGGIVTAREDDASKQDEIELTALSAPQAEPEQGRSKIRVTAIMTALMLTLFIAALDQTIIATVSTLQSLVASSLT